jgi:hypothetical protein
MWKNLNFIEDDPGQVKTLMEGNEAEEKDVELFDTSLAKINYIIEQDDFEIQQLNDNYYEGREIDSAMMNLSHQRKNIVNL